MRERKYDGFARIIQKAFRQYFARKQYQKLKEQACSLLVGKKERRHHSINRNFVGDYIGLEDKPGLRALIGKRERIEFAETVNKYDRRFKVTKRDLILTPKNVYLIGRERVKKGPEKGVFKEVIKRKIDIENISHLSLSTHQDDFVVLHVKNDYGSLLEITFKTEFLTLLNRKFMERLNKPLNIQFSDLLEFKVKKEGFGGGGTKQVKVVNGQDSQAICKVSGKLLTVSIGPGLPKESRPGVRNAGKARTSMRPLVTHKQTSSTRLVSRRNAPTPPSSNPALQLAHALESKKLASSITNSKNNQRNSASSDKVPAVTKEILERKLSSQNKVYAHNSNGTAQDFLKTPEAGVAGLQRLNTRQVKPPPGGGRPKPPAKPKPALPKCKAIYSYDAQDTDELSFSVNDVISVIKQDPSGWWLGRIKGKEGLFPSNYVETI